MRILVSKPDSLGDQLIIAGWLQALTDAVPGGTVVWHVQPGLEVVASILAGAEVFRPSLEALPEMEVDRFRREHPKGLVMVPFPLHAFSDWSGETDARLTWWTAFLQAQSWDVAVAAVGNRTWVAEITVAVSRAPLRIGAQVTATRQTPVNLAGHLLSAHAPIFHRELPFDAEAPEGDSLVHLLRAIGLPLPQMAPPRLRDRPFPIREHRVLLAPGVGGPPHRAWPATGFLSLAENLEAAGWEVEWIEGPGDRAFLDPIRARSSRPVRSFTQDQLGLLVDLLRASAALVCNDTAYAHLAAIVGIPTVAVFGGGQRSRFHPRIGSVKVVQGLPPCSGCQWHCVYGAFPCISILPAEQIFNALLGLLKGGSTEPEFVLQAEPSGASGPSLVARLQNEILQLDADRFARLQIIQTLLDQARRAPAPAPATHLPTGPGKISVIVPMGRPERASGTFEALAAQTSIPGPWEIIVAGAGRNALTDVPSTLPIRQVLMPERASPSRTRIAGVSAASGEWYLFVDDDIELAPDFLERATVLIAGFAHTPAGRQIGAIGARLPGRTGAFWEKITDLSNFWSQQGLHARSCSWLYSATLLVRADAYHAAGGFDPELPVGEDVDLTQRIAAKGFSLRYEPSLVAYHHHRRDTPTAMWRYFWTNGDGARFFFRAIGGACAFSLKTIWLKTWSDLRLNRNFQHEQGSSLGYRAPLVWLNYLIVETSLEWHWQRHLRQDQRYRIVPVRARSDATYVRAMNHWDEGRGVRGALLYLLAMLQDLGNPVRR